MNERIRLLAEHAGFKVNWQHEDVQAIKMARLEKFAELIVKECANHCDLLLDHKISSEWSRGTHDCSKAIKKHFGVEE
jgi:hypothetical protein